MATDLDLLRDLCAAPAPTGFEAPVQDVVRRRLSALAAPRATRWATSGARSRAQARRTSSSPRTPTRSASSSPTWTSKGFVSFDKIGGVDPQLLPGRNLVIHGANGPVNGVVGRKPSHKMTKEERAKAPDLSDQWLDIGCSTPRGGPGPRADRRPHHLPAELPAAAGARYASPAFDNRAGVYVCLRALEHYAAAPAAADLTALLTVHEETTFMGAKAMAMRRQPDVIIVVDVDFASDDPGLDAKKLGGEVKLGAGPVIHRGAGGNLALTDLALEVAEDEGIPVQVKAMPGNTSTDAEELMAAGEAATLSFSIPLRNMHSAFEVIAAGRRRGRRAAGRRRRRAASPRRLGPRALRAARLAGSGRRGRLEAPRGAVSALPGPRPSRRCGRPARNSDERAPGPSGAASVAASSRAISGCHWGAPAPSGGTGRRSRRRAARRAARCAGRDTP